MEKIAVLWIVVLYDATKHYTPRGAFVFYNIKIVFTHTVTYTPPLLFG